MLLGHLTVALLYVASAAEGACFVFANLARFAAFRRVVPPEHYPAAIAQSSMADYIALLLGPALGGFLYQLAGPGVALLTDGCSYAVNALSIFFITVPLQDPHDRTSSTLVADIRAGIGWLWGQPLLRHLNLLAAGRTAIASGLYLLIIVLARHDLLRLVELGSYSFGFFGTGMLLQYAGSVAAIIFLSGLLLALTVFAGLNSLFRAL